MKHRACAYATSLAVVDWVPSDLKRTMQQQQDNLAPKTTTHKIGQPQQDDELSECIENKKIPSPPS